MKKFKTYHCHSTFSDGLNSIEEMVEAAIAKNFTTIGFSDHIVLSPNYESVYWSMDIKQLDNYVSTVRNIASKYQEIEVLLGAEIDFFANNPRADELLNIINKYDFDFLVGSIHIIDNFPLDENAEYWSKLTIKEVDEKYLTYYKTIQQMVKWYKFDIVGHLDIPKKFCFKPSFDQTKLIDETLDIIKESGATVEINTAGLDKDCHELYPSPYILKMCLNKGIKIIINDDAHSIDNLGRYYSEAEKSLEAAKQY